MRFLPSFRLWGAVWILTAAWPRSISAAPPPAPPAPPTGAAAVTPPARKLPRLALTTYYYWYQADPRKPAPVSHTRRADGSSLLASHPWEGTGPWLSYDR